MSTQPDTSDFASALATVDSQPLWDRFKTLVTREPTAPDAPHIWSWASMLPMIERAVREVSMDDAERRVLLLTNPAFKGQVQTTTNLNGALQILGGREHAHAHRHRLAAIRLVMQGSTAKTIVDGKVCPMLPGDLILTPSMTWHAHENEGDERVVWFDGLDLPLALLNMNVVCFEPGPEAPGPDDLSRLPDTAFAGAGLSPMGATPAAGHSPRFRYPWASVLAAFQGMQAAPDGSKILRYTNPATGGAVIPTLDCYALELAAGRPTRQRRATHNAIAVVVEGEGMSRIGATQLHWRKNDVFTIPHWNWTSHEAASQGARIFLMTDREVLHRLGYLVEETREI
jgi:gentisate 1,2-dioxygenase